MKPRRKTKRLTALSLILFFCVVLAGGCGSESDEKTRKSTVYQEDEKLEISNTGKTLRIYCWNNEIQDRFKDYVESAGIIPDSVKVEWVVTPNESHEYQDALDAGLKKQLSAKAEDRIDMFMMEADYALKYVDSDYTIDVKELGITDDDLKNQYNYTKEIATDAEGRLKAVTWQATPGLFTYRRSIAKDVLGTDDPQQVQEYLCDWDHFNNTAARMKKKGYYMLSGYDDSYRAFLGNVSAPWVNGKDEIVIDDNLMKWVDQTKEYTEKGYNHGTTLWSDEWKADQGPGSKVFGFFYSTWGINFTLKGNSLKVPVEEGGKEEVGNGVFGDYAVCEGPESYSWGGTWICAAAGTDNGKIVADIMKKLTCDTETMKKISEDTEDYTNNKEAMEKLAASNYQSAFLGGQNHIQLFTEVAPKIDKTKLSKYDQGCNEEFQEVFHDYFTGKSTKEECIETFYQNVINIYPNLQIPGQ